MAVVPQISLVTGTIGRVDDLRALAGSLEAQSVELEWILVDQSGDRAVERFVAELPEGTVRLIRDRQRGIARARNLGLLEARAPIVGFPDDDCRLPPSVLTRVLQHFAEPGVDGIVGRISADPERPGPSADPKELSRYFYPSQSAAMFLRREMVQELGGFNEALGAGAGTEWGAGEETDLVMRAIVGGFRLLHVPDVVIEHGETVTSPEKAYAYGCGTGRVLRLNGYPRAYLLLRAAKACGLASIAALRGDKLNASIRVNWARGALRGFRG